MKKIVPILIIAIIFQSCSKKLNLAPLDTISDATFWKTPSDYTLATNALYNSLEGFGFEDTQAETAYNVGNDISRGTFLPTQVSSLWTNAYAYIRRANNILLKGAAYASPNDIKIQLAEAKFFRAYNYWLLFRDFGGVPIIKDVLDVNDKKLYEPRADRKTTVDFILKDLTEAAGDLPKDSSLSSSDIGRITEGAALGLKARIALFEGTWEKFRSDAGSNEYLDEAIDASNQIITGNEYSLYTEKGNQSYRYLFIEEGDDSKECILDRRYQKNIQGQSYPYLIDRVGYLPTKKLADMYLCKDGLPITKSPEFDGYDTFTSEFDNRDPRMTMTMIIPGTKTVRPFYPNPPGVANWPDNPQRVPNTGYITYKYLSEDETANSAGETGNSNSYDKHIIRYAEILLIYAEATFEKNNSISDLDLDRSINLIRSRAGMPPLTNSFVNSNGLDMRDEIRRERTVELALEGFRYDDIRRWKTAEVEMKQDIKGIKIKNSNWQNKKPYNDPSYQNRTDQNGFLIVESGSNRFFDPSKDYLQPLPTKEILLNPALKQNPGW
jgi:starch-binding outer membrane protein, SusD/RagB family